MTVPDWSAILEVQDPDGTRTRHPFRHPRVAVGRTRDNDLSLADEGVSHRHCEFVSREGWFLVRDLGSQNGTWVNGRRVGEARLRDGDEVRIGATSIRVSVQGGVRRPDRRSKARLLGVLLGLAVAGGIFWGLFRRQSRLHAAYLSALREQLGNDACVAPQFAPLEAVEARIAGRSVALTLRDGEPRLTREDLALDRELAGLYPRKLALYQEAIHSLTQAQQERRESAERLSRAGQRLWSSRERKAAAFVESLVQERVQAVDELSQALQLLADDTAALTGTLASLLDTSPDRATAAWLQRFRFRADLRAARTACEQRSARAGTGLAGALSALGE